MFWSKLKPVEREPRLLSVDLAEDGVFVLRWEDEKQTRISFRDLRVACPCAACVDEWTGAQILDPARVPHDVRPVAMEPVGNYALQIRWSDGHETGIYSFRLLRRLIS
ncbi:MAG: DUF971 domain-containing protein [Pseudomonadota bacterium]|nr:MAG: DUF971 domain-containing protein [Pseudomonadota bacterium]